MLVEWPMFLKIVGLLVSCIGLAGDVDFAAVAKVTLSVISPNNDIFIFDPLTVQTYP